MYKDIIKEFHIFAGIGGGIYGGTLLNVSKSTLQRWDKEGKLIAVRTEGGYRRYKLSDIEKILGKEQTVRDNNDIIVATYARCSTQDQKAHGDIDRQSSRIFEYCTKHNYKVEYIIKDMGSGLNDKRKGLLTVNGNFTKSYFKLIIFVTFFVLKLFIYECEKITK